jgi:hypothetical protein
VAKIDEEVSKLAKDKVENLEDAVTVALPADPTQQQILDAAALLQRPNTNGGYREIAKSVGIKTSQVKRIHRAMKTRLAELAALEVE